MLWIPKNSMGERGGHPSVVSCYSFSRGGPRSSFDFQLLPASPLLKDSPLPRGQIRRGQAATPHSVASPAHGILDGKRFSLPTMRVFTSLAAASLLLLTPCSKAQSQASCTSSSIWRIRME